MEGRKRKHPTRSTRAEPATKKRAASASTSITPEQRETPTPVVAAPSPIVEEKEKESLPKTITAGQPLPTVDVPQPENLPSKEFQSVSESGVLADSLQRSRHKWISEGIFEKYWTKTTKKKGSEEPPNNPSRDTMTKLGGCTIVVEPHSFDAVIYTVKDPNARPALTQAPPLTRPPIMQYGPPNGMMPPPTPTPPPQYQQFPTPQAAVNPLPEVHDKIQKTSMSPAPAPNNIQSPSVHAIGQSRTLQNGQTTTENLPNPTEPADKSKDPVIQMLAERAANDPELKSLMKIVAQGQASSDELKKFQSHIDDLTRLQKSRQLAPSQPPTAMQSQSPSGPATPQSNYLSRPAQSPAPVVRAMPTPPPPRPVAQAQPQALRSKGPVPSKGDVTGMAFEFTGGNGDRYLFPRFSILEYKGVDPYTGNGMVIVSFLIARKGSSSDSPTYDPNLDYYQPITIRLYAHPKYIEALQRVVAPPDEVRRYMEDVMDNMTRAEYVLLAMRLPRETEQQQQPPPPEKPEIVQAENIVEPEEQVLWATTNGTGPVTKIISKTKKPLGQPQDKYQCFINTISSTS